MKRELHQKITNWTVTEDGYGGFTYGTPSTIDGRWEGKNIVFRSAKGEEETSDAVVYLSTDVEVGSYLFEGATVVADPTTINAFRVRQFNKIADLRNVRYQRKAFV